MLKSAFQGETINSDLTRVLLASCMICVPIAALAQVANDQGKYWAPRPTSLVDAATAAQQIVDVPLPGSCADPVYPEASIRDDETGRTTLQFSIDAAGNVVDGAVIRSSGFNRLNDAALAALRLCKYKPRTANGKPVKGTVRVQWTWSLE